MYIISQQALLSFQETSTTILFSGLRDLCNEILKWNMKSLQVVSQQEQKRMWQGKETAASGSQSFGMLLYKCMCNALKWTRK